MSGLRYLIGARIIAERRIIEGHVLVFDDTFRDIIPLEGFDAGGRDLIDAKGLYAAPGLIDVHIHGSGGRDTMEGTVDAIGVISSAIAKNGVTSFLATTMTMDWPHISHALSAVRDAMRDGLPGAQVLGAHLEGPFINAKYKRAQNGDSISAPDWGLIAPFRDVIKAVTLAPEEPGATDFIRKLTENNIIASMGHTSASYEEAALGIRAGVSRCTHLFNGMEPLHHRRPGAAAAALSGDVYCEIIADGNHVHPAMYGLVRKLKGADRILLITDSMEAGGMADGRYSLGGQAVDVKNGEARLADGTLAGSVAALNRCVYNFYKHSGTELTEAVGMASLNPARELKIDDRKGSIAIGKDADLILTDERMDVKATFVKGKCVYKK